MFQFDLIQKPHFRKIISALLAIAMLFCSFVIFGSITANAAGSLSLSASSAILIDAASGRVLYERNANEERPQASTTKIMTAIIALEASDPKKTVKVSQKAVGVEVDGKFGNGTKNAVIKWQKLMGLNADGVVGYNTWKKILGVR
jgi:D-alanyl-D-alanine carboxypeptidase